MKRFVCPVCEDGKTVEDEVKGTTCECGGVMEEGKPDLFDEVEYIEPCMICRNRNSDKCKGCYRE